MTGVQTCALPISVQDVMKAKQALDDQRTKLESEGKKMDDSTYNASLAKIKAGNIGGKKIQTMTVIIKATDNATYKNLVDALDEMQICSIGKYVIDKMNADDEALLKKNNVKE